MTPATWHVAFLFGATGLLVVVLILHHERERNLVLYVPLLLAYVTAVIALILGVVFWADEGPSLFIGALGIVATVLAITAGLGEIQEALPRQEVEVWLDARRESKQGPVRLTLHLTNRGAVIQVLFVAANLWPRVEASGGPSIPQLLTDWTLVSESPLPPNVHATVDLDNHPEHTVHGGRVQVLWSSDRMRRLGEAWLDIDILPSGEEAREVLALRANRETDG